MDLLTYLLIVEPWMIPAMIFHQLRNAAIELDVVRMTTEAIINPVIGLHRICYSQTSHLLRVNCKFESSTLKLVPVIFIGCVDFLFCFRYNVLHIRNSKRGAMWKYRFECKGNERSLLQCEQHEYPSFKHGVFISCGTLTANQGMISTATVTMYPEL